MKNGWRFGLDLKAENELSRSKIFTGLASCHRKTVPSEYTESEFVRCRVIYDRTWTAILLDSRLWKPLITAIQREGD
jgi:hypothetical protein